jgi:hypothetical protein
VTRRILFPFFLTLGVLISLTACTTRKSSDRPATDRANRGAESGTVPNATGAANAQRTDEVNAKFFRKVTYDSGQLRLTVYFTNGSIYSYEKVPAAKYRQLIGSTDPGTFFNTDVRDKFTARMIHARTAPYRPSPRKTRPAAVTFQCVEPAPNTRTHVSSVILDYAAYDGQNQCMVLYFDRGYVYQYGNVPPGVFKGLIETNEVDKFFNDQIWGKYPRRQTKRR